MDEIDSKQNQIHNTKKNEKLRTLKVHGSNSKDKAKQNKETKRDKNIKKTTTNQKNKILPRKT